MPEGLTSPGAKASGVLPRAIHENQSQIQRQLTHELQIYILRK